MGTWQVSIRMIASGLSLLLLALFAGAADRAEANDGRHPYFDDGGTLTWYQTYASARQAARCSGKLVFIESGRLRCTQCRRICQSVLPDRSIRSRIAKIAVGFAHECDHPERAVTQLFRSNLSKPKQLPLVAFVTPDGRWVTGFWGGRNARQFAQYLAIAEREWNRMNAPRRPAAPAPQPQPAPEPTPDPAPTFVLEEDTVLEDDTPPCCEGPDCQCPGGVCTPPPAFDVPDLLAEKPEPKAAPRSEPPSGNGFPAPTTDVAPLPEPNLKTPEVRRVPAPASRGLPAPQQGAQVAMGDPDAATIEAPKPPRPVEDVRKTTTALRPASTNRTSARLKADKAAARGQWGEVLRLTERRTDDRAMLELNRRAHAWAHDTLQDALRLIESGKIQDGRDQVELVKREMDGQPEGEDARRGLDAIEFVQDLTYLEKDSLVRRAVARNAYEKMRGSRWARLFRASL